MLNHVPQRLYEFTHFVMGKDKVHYYKHNYSTISTLVTAGCYLLLRSSPLLEYSSTALLVILWVGAITAFFAASTGLLQNDLKRIIAFSTISQMGYIFLAVGLKKGLH